MRIDLEHFLAVTLGLAAVGTMGCATSPPPSSSPKATTPAPAAPATPATPAPPSEPVPPPAEPEQGDAQPPAEQDAPGPTEEVPDWD